MAWSTTPGIGLTVSLPAVPSASETFLTYITSLITTHPIPCSTRHVTLRYPFGYSDGYVDDIIATAESSSLWLARPDFLAACSKIRRQGPNLYAFIGGPGPDWEYALSITFPLLENVDGLIVDESGFSSNTDELSDFLEAISDWALSNHKLLILEPNRPTGAHPGHLYRYVDDSYSFLYSGVVNGRTIVRITSSTPYTDAQTIVSAGMHAEIPIENVFASYPNLSSLL